MSRAEAFQRVAAALERRDFTGVSEDDLALCDHEHANSLYRQWLAGGRQPLPLYDDEEGNDCVDEVLVRIASRVQSIDGRMRLTLEHHEPLRLFPGDTIFIRRSTPLRDQERR